MKNNKIEQQLANYRELLYCMHVILDRAESDDPDDHYSDTFETHFDYARFLLRVAARLSD